MLFPTSAFLIFFLVVAAAMAMLDTSFTAKKAVLVVASYYFYAQWDWRFCFLLAFSTAVSYAAGLLIDGHAATGPGESSGCRGSGAFAAARNLQIFRFFRPQRQRAGAFARLTHELPFLEILLPVGISFFTFHGISYVMVQGQANAPVDALERRHHAIARMPDTGVNGLGLPLDGSASCIHDLPPLYVGQRLDGAAGPLHRPPRARHGNGWRVSA